MLRALMCLDFRDSVPLANGVHRCASATQQSVQLSPSERRHAAWTVRGARLEHEQEHGLQQGEDNGEALLHAVCKDTAKIRALARANMAAPKIPTRWSTLTQHGMRCDSADGHKALRAKAQSLCAGLE